MQSIVSGQEESWAGDVSADGSVIVGTKVNPQTGLREGFRWTAATGAQGLGSLGGESFAAAVSEDGTVIVGNAYAASASGWGRAFRWTAAAGMTELGTLGGRTSAAFGVSADGSVIVGWSTDALLRERACRWTLSGEIGAVLCTATATNSAGGTGRLVAVGTNVLLTPDFRLRASGLSTNSTAFAFVSRASAMVPNPGGSQGTLCLGGAIGRLLGPGQVQNTGATGTFELALDPRMLPTPIGNVATMAGERWLFQAWYRDAIPGFTSNFTDAIAVTWK
jgi:probable HAF family extracellular repeat protein